MPTITLPDGTHREYENSVSVFDIAKSIGSGLAKAALAGRVDGKLVDTSFLVECDSSVAIVTAKDDDGLEVIRHSCAHLMAQAVQRLYPKAQVTIGPVIDNGFFYDFAYEPGFQESDLEKIESIMKKIVKENLTVERSEMTRDEAIAFFRGKGEDYKAKIIEGIPSNEALSLYQQGEFIDLCRGPHVPRTGMLKAFTLEKLAGAYWRGDSNNEMLQRVYGTAWATKDQLKDYLFRIEEAKKRDHRLLGKRLDLFHTQEESPGMVFWHPRGWQIWLTIEAYIRNTLRNHGYQEIKTPQIVDRILWEKSGHWDKFSDEMFTTGSENKEYAVKPMNCPCHVQVFNQGLKSYRDLPLRLSEFGSCHRNEPSGTLHGLMRVRGFVQDDAHIFCTEEQIQTEVNAFDALVFQVYQVFGFTDVIIKLSTRPEKRVGADALWDKAEKALADALDEKGHEWQIQEGEGAFYGPKIEYSLKDSIGRVWQLGTMQVDFSTPGLLSASYVSEDGSKQTPVMLHRAILGSFERFIGILIEHHAGNLPLWLAPVQLIVMNITDRQNKYCKKIADSLGKKGFRVETDLRNEKIGFKIREHTMQKIPYLLVIGDREEETSTMAVRLRDGENIGSLELAGLIARLDSECELFN